jgi:hypothetical protein
MGIPMEITLLSQLHPQSQPLSGKGANSLIIPTMREESIITVSIHFFFKQLQSYLNKLYFLLFFFRWKTFMGFPPTTVERPWSTLQ